MKLKKIYEQNVTVKSTTTKCKEDSFSYFIWKQSQDEKENLLKKEHEI